MISGRFHTYPNLLSEFAEDGLTIIEASDEIVRYSDGSFITKPFEPLYIGEEMSFELLAYVERAAKVLAGKLDPQTPSVASLVIAEALHLWSNDLQHRFGEMASPERPTKPDEAYTAAVQYAMEHRDQPLQWVSEKFKKPYEKLIQQLRLCYTVDSGN